MSYLLLKYTHIVCAAASFALFFIRGIWAIRAYPSVQEPWAKALPHVIDGLLVLCVISDGLGRRMDAGKARVDSCVCGYGCVRAAFREEQGSAGNTMVCRVDTLFVHNFNRGASQSGWYFSDSVNPQLLAI
jgi:hypothetical protein